MTAAQDSRAQFEAWAAANYHGINLEHEGRSYRYSLAYEWWSAWQASRAALSAEPVAVPHGLLEAAQQAHDWMDSQADSQSKGNHQSFDLFCLRQERDALAKAIAAAPQPAAQERKPLTDEQLDSLSLDGDGLPKSHLEFARAIERAHGITGEAV